MKTVEITIDIDDYKKLRIVAGLKKHEEPGQQLMWANNASQLTFGRLHVSQHIHRYKVYRPL